MRHSAGACSRRVRHQHHGSGVEQIGDRRAPAKQSRLWGSARTEPTITRGFRSDYGAEHLPGGSGPAAQSCYGSCRRVHGLRAGSVPPRR